MNAPRISLTGKVCTLVAISVLPILLLSGGLYYQSLSVREPQFNQPASDSQESWHKDQFSTLLGITVMLAILTSLVSAYFAHRLFRSVIKQTAGRVQDSEASSQKDLNEAFQRIHQSKASKIQIFQTLVDETKKIVQTDRAIVIVLNQDHEGIVVAESVAADWPKAMKTTFQHPYFKLENSDVEVIETLQDERLSEAYLDWLTQLQVESCLTIPIFFQAELTGLLIAHQCSSTRQWHSSEIERLRQLSLQAGFTLETTFLARGQTRLQKKLKDEVQWKQYLIDASQYLHEFSSEGQVLNAAVEETRRVLGSDRVVIYSTDQRAQGIIIAESVAQGWPKILGQTIIDPCFEAKYISMYADGRVRAWEDIHKAGMSPCYIEQLESIAVKANMVAPVIHEGKLLGLLVAHQCSETRKWAALDIRWFTHMAIQVGFALDNAKLIRRVEQMDKQVVSITNTYQQANTEVQDQVSSLLAEGRSVFDKLSTESNQKMTLATETMKNIGNMATSVQLTHDYSEKATIKTHGMVDLIQVWDETLKVNQENLIVLTKEGVDTSVSINKLQATIPNITESVQKIIRLTTGLLTDQNPNRREELRQTAINLEELTQFMIDDVSAIEKSHNNSSETLLISKEQTQELLSQVETISITSQEVDALVSKVKLLAQEQTKQVNNTRQPFQETVQLVNQSAEQTNMIAGLLMKLMAIAEQIQFNDESGRSVDP